MRTEMLYGIDTWVIGLALLALLIIIPFMAFRLGRRLHASGLADDPQLGTIIGSVLGLLALLLGFTFSMSASRFDQRKQMVVREANAIGTTYLRADFLPEAQRVTSKKLLRQYVENRISLFDGRPDKERDAERQRETNRLQSELWTLAVAAGRAEPQSNPVKLYVESLNDAMDQHDVRVSAMRNHVPEIILVSVFLVAVAGVSLVGYGCGLHGRSTFIDSIAVAILTVLIIMLIIDLDRPRRGVIQVEPASLERLRDSLKDGD